MTTPLIPTKTALASTTYTPAQLVADAAVETFLIQHTGFVRAMMTAYRTGATSFTYVFPLPADALYMAAILGTGTDYDYTVTGPETTQQEVTSRTITVSWA